MITLYGKNGAPVGFKDGDWIFDELEKPVGTLVNGDLIYPPTWQRIGSFRDNVLYDGQDRPAAVGGPEEKDRMIAHLKPVVGSMAERLVPPVSSIADRASKELDAMPLVASLINFGRVK